MSNPTSSSDSPAFLRSFERWRQAITSLAVPLPKLTTPLRCEGPVPAPHPSSSPSSNPLTNKPEWEDGAIMKVDKAEEPLDPAAAEKQRKREAKDCKRCEQMRDELTRESPIVRFLLQHIALLPPTKPQPADSPTPHLPLPIACKPCPPTLAGGFSSDLGILLCQNRFMSRKHMEDALSHELVHAYDSRRFRPVGGDDSWAEDLRAHACTEIRAENLSGDCSFGREFTRRNWNFTKQHQACVRRRAILSVEANPNCKSKAEAERVVNEVWESCWPDTRPFDEIY